jgi:crossover junction endodeoxyribonuclease RuvC
MACILGVDPGLNITGYGVVEAGDLGEVRLIEGGAIRPCSKDPLEARLVAIHAGIDEILEEHRPVIVAVEELYSKYEHPRTAILMGHARGAVYLAAGQRGIPVVGYTASRVKQAVAGNGRASKGQVQAMVQRALELDEAPSPEDVSDALALALCHANTLATARELPPELAALRGGRVMGGTRR